LLLTGSLLFWAAPAGAYVGGIVPSIESASILVTAPQNGLHDTCTDEVSEKVCEETLTVIEVHVHLPDGAGEDCEGPAVVGYATEISGGHLTSHWPGGDEEQNCAAVCSSPTGECTEVWNVYPFAYAGTPGAACTQELAVEVSLEYLGNGVGPSTASTTDPQRFEHPGCSKEAGGGQAGGTEGSGTGTSTSGSGTSGSGAGSNGTSGSGTGGGGTGGGSCLTTATCVSPLNFSGVIRGQPYVVHANGSRTPLQEVTSLKSGDWIKTGSNGVARWGMGYSNGVGMACAIWAAPNTGMVFTTFMVSAQGMLFWSAVLAKGEVVVQEAVVGVTVKTPNAIVKAGTAAKASQAGAAAAGATFTVGKTGSNSLVQVYAGAVTVSDAHGKHAVVVKAGFQSSVTGSAPPSRSRRFTVPKHRFWN